MYPIKDAAFTEQIMWVFGLTGGELEDHPLRVLVEDAYRGWIRYWYQGVPDYVQSIFRPAARAGEFRTILRDLSHGPSPAFLRTSDGRRWRRVAQYSTSGEVECPNEDHGPHDGKCPVCEQHHPEEGSSYIYIGEGWHEVIYYARG